MKTMNVLVTFLAFALRPAVSRRDRPKSNQSELVMRADGRDNVDMKNLSRVDGAASDRFGQEFSGAAAQQEHTQGEHIYRDIRVSNASRTSAHMQEATPDVTYVASDADGQEIWLVHLRTDIVGSVTTGDVQSACSGAGMAPVCGNDEVAGQAGCVAMRGEGDAPGHTGWFQYRIYAPDSCTLEVKVFCPSWNVGDPTGRGTNLGPTFTLRPDPCGVWQGTWCYTGGLVDGHGYAICTGTYTAATTTTTAATPATTSAPTPAPTPSPTPTPTSAPTPATTPGNCIDSSAVLNDEMIELPGQTFRAISFYSKPVTPNGFWLCSNLFYNWCYGDYAEYGGYSSAGNYNAWYTDGTLWTSPSRAANSCPLTNWNNDLAQAEWHHVYIEFAQDVSPTSVCLFGRYTYEAIMGMAVFGSLTTWNTELTATELQEDVAMTLDPSATGKMVNHYTAADIEPYRVVAGGSASTKTFTLGEGVGTCTAATEAPTPPPGTTSDGATATGDPHMENIHGERFDLMRPGSVLLISVPRGSVGEDALLVVEADARRLGGRCADIYFQKLNITGTWADKTQSGGLFFDVSKERESRARWNRIGPVELKVVHGHTNSGTRYLNFFIKHLGQTGFAVGGLLGEDDYTEAATPTPGCETTIALNARERSDGASRSESSVAVAS